uniref:Retrotransposon gag domain-containing protein n=1 Tax=Populus alba TaxID=43335 RepID=A0A4U5QPF3_POPAL|nr:hypothetical protein D5086_0000060760 [Populus alba]
MSAFQKSSTSLNTANNLPIFSHPPYQTHMEPSTTITLSDGSTTPNPAYDIWETQDNLILSCINSSLSDEVLAQVAHCSTSVAVWLSLSSLFASQPRAKAIHVRSQLSTLRKGNQSATEYFMTIKRLTNDLAIAGQPLNCDDIITYLLAGLGPEYDTLISMISH